MQKAWAFGKRPPELLKLEARVAREFFGYDVEQHDSANFKKSQNIEFGSVWDSKVRLPAYAETHDGGAAVMAQLRIRGIEFEIRVGLGGIRIAGHGVETCNYQHLPTALCCFVVDLLNAKVL